MNNTYYSCYEFSIRVKVFKSIIGCRMRVKDNSYIVRRSDNATGFLYGTIVEIVSEPYEEKIETFMGDMVKHTFVNVISIESGIVYRVLFNEKWIIESSKKQKVADVRGRKLILGDGSYSKEIYGNGRLHGIDKAKLTIVSKPYAVKVSDFGFEDICLFVDTYEEKSGKFYRVLFREQDLID